MRLTLWGFTTLFLLLLAAEIGTATHGLSVSYLSPRVIEYRFQLGGGGLAASYVRCHSPPGCSGHEFTWRRLDPVGWQPVGLWLPGQVGFLLPLWIPLVLSAIPTLRCWLRRPAPGGRFCNSCGYDLIGNISGRCPECGTAANTESVVAERGRQ